MFVVDELGNQYKTLAKALGSYGCSAGGNAYISFKKHKYIKRGGHTFYAREGEIVEEAKAKPVTPIKVEDPLLSKLRERYSDEELDLLAKGEGIAKKYIPTPQIHLHGKHHRILVMSDTHIGSVYAPEEWHDVLSCYANDPANKIECIFHVGDLVDGLKVGRDMQIYELSAIGFDAQRDKAIELMSKYDRPVYIISGNHDMYFKASAGANIVQSVCEAVPNLTYIGHDTADIEIDGATIRLFHGSDGSSYALSYSLQKLIEGTTGKMPRILIRGHIHKYVSIYDSGKDIFGISCPAMQKQTAFLRGKKIQVHTGFLVMDFEVNDGKICNFSLTYFPFHE